MRIALPAIGNQYLNLAKNSSLALVVSVPRADQGHPAGVAQGAPTVASTILLLGIYLCISLTLSLFVNLLNYKLKIVER